VRQIFDILDTSGDGTLAFEELRTLSARTGGEEMAYETYEQVCQAAACDPAVGVGFPGLCRVYLELDMGDARVDLEKMAGRLAAEEVIIPHHETFRTTIQPPYSSAKG
jgi:hypothetical protein